MMQRGLLTAYSNGLCDPQNLNGHVRKEPWVKAGDTLRQQISRQLFGAVSGKEVQAEENFR